MHEEAAASAEHLLSDAEMAAFISRGLHVVAPGVGPAVHRRVCKEIEQLHAGSAAAFDDHTLHGETRERPNSNDLLRQVPSLAEVCGDARVCGALASLLGPRHYQQVHRHVHFKSPSQPEGREAAVEQWQTARFQQGNLHQDGRFRALGGWNRFFRHPYLPFKLVVFYFPHAVTELNGPTQVVEGSQYFGALTAAQVERAVALSVPAGSFVLLHSSIWHRATPELAGRRRIMVKLNYDRTDAPHPSWNHQAGTPPGWPTGVDPVQSPWLLHTWQWMCACEAGPRQDVLTDAQTDRLIAKLLTGEGTSLELLRAACQLGAGAPTADGVAALLAALPCAVADDSPVVASPSQERQGWSTHFEGFAIVMAVSAFGHRAAPALLREIAAAAPGKRKAVLLDLLLDCGGSEAASDRIGCFVECLADAEPWVRHSAAQALELSASHAAEIFGARQLCSALAPLLSDENEFLIWEAISALRYSSGTDRCLLRELCSRLQPLVAPGSAFVRWKAQESLALVEAQLAQSTGGPGHPRL